jgi:hypothetical protein
MRQLDVFFLYLSGAKSFKRNRRMRFKRHTGKSNRYHKGPNKTGEDSFNNRRRKHTENTHLLHSEQKDILLDTNELEMDSGITYNRLQTIHPRYNAEIEHFHLMDRTLSKHSRRKNRKLIKKRRRNGNDDILSSGGNFIVTIGAESKQTRRNRSRKTERKSRTEQNRRGNERMINRELGRIQHTRSLFKWYPNDNSVPTVSTAAFTHTRPSRITGMRSALSAKIRSKVQQAIAKIVSAHREQCKAYLQIVLMFLIQCLQGRIQGGGAPGARPPKIGKNMIFWRKIVIFHMKYPKNFRSSLRSAQFF